MKRVFKWVGIVLGSIVGLLAIAIGVIVGLSVLREGETYEVSVQPIELPTDEASLTEGERLWMSRGCGDCHGEDATGRDVVDAPPMHLVGPNLTVATADWRVEDHVRAIRHGVAPDGRPLRIMPSHEYHHFSDADVGRIIAHYTRLPRRETNLPEVEIKVPGRILHVLGLFPILPAEHIDHDAPLPRAPDVAETVAYGAYIAQGCRGCHGDTFSGGPIPGTPEEALGRPANLTPHESGLRGWSRDEFITLMRTGRRPNGTSVNPNFMPWRTFRHMSDVELGATYLYLAQLPPRPYGNR